MSKYTFNPPEEELIHYLNNKITEKEDPEEKLINDVSICHYEPADLPGLAKIESKHTWYFISPVEKFGKLNRTKRATRSGHWKITGNSRTIKDSNSNPIGLKIYLGFQKKKKSSSSSVSTITRQHYKSTWIIHEFHSFIQHPNKDAFVLCKLMKKTSPRERAAISEHSSVALDHNSSQTLTENKSIVEDYDLEDLLPEFHNWFDHTHYNHFHSDYTDILQSLEEDVSGQFSLGEKGQNTRNPPI